MVMSGCLEEAESDPTGSVSAGPANIDPANTDHTTTGVVFYESDTPGMDGLIYKSGSILAIKADQWEAFIRDSIEPSQLTGLDWRNIELGLNHILYDKYALQAAPLVVSTGRYRLELESGSYFFCAADLNGPPADTGRYRTVVKGCTQRPINIPVPDGKVNFLVGESGFSVSFRKSDAVDAE